MSECEDCGEVECRCDTYDTAQRVAPAAGVTCSEYRRRVAAGEAYVEHWGIIDGDDWDETLCLSCDALMAFALAIVSRTGMPKDNGPCFGETVRATDYKRRMCALRMALKKIKVMDFMSEAIRMAATAIDADDKAQGSTD